MRGVLPGSGSSRAERISGRGAAVPVWLSLIVPVAALGLAVALRVSASGRESFALAIVGVTGCLVSPVSMSVTSEQREAPTPQSGVRA